MASRQISPSKEYLKGYIEFKDRCNNYMAIVNMKCLQKNKHLAEIKYKLTIESKPLR